MTLPHLINQRGQIIPLTLLPAPPDSKSYLQLWCNIRKFENSTHTSHIPNHSKYVIHRTVNCKNTKIHSFRFATSLAYLVKTFTCLIWWILLGNLKNNLDISMAKTWLMGKTCSLSIQILLFASILKNQNFINQGLCNEYFYNEFD